MFVSVSSRSASANYVGQNRAEHYSYDDLEPRRAVWDGVKNPVALRKCGRCTGDQVLVYHTGDEKRRRVATVVSAPTPIQEKDRN